MVLFRKEKTYTESEVKALLEAKQTELLNACADSFLDGIFAANTLHVVPFVDKQGNFAITRKGELLLGKFAYNGQFQPTHKHYPLRGISPVSKR